MSLINEVRTETAKDCYDKATARDVLTRCEDVFQSSGDENDLYFEGRLKFLKEFGSKGKKPEIKKRPKSPHSKRRITNNLHKS